jgi:hypothetical protein
MQKHHSIKDTKVPLPNIEKYLLSSILTEYEKLHTFGRVRNSTDKELAVGGIVVVPAGSLVTALITLVIPAVGASYAA